MASDALERGQNALCAAALTVLDQAGCPRVSPPGAPAAEVMVPLRPALQALRVPRFAYEMVEQAVSEDPMLYPWEISAHTETPDRGLLVKLDWLMAFVCWMGRHPICTTYRDWHCDVLAALMQYGHYDPTTGHAAPPGKERELDALEMRECSREMGNAMVPGFGDALSEHMPQTGEEVRTLFYRVVGASGPDEFINGLGKDENEDEDEEGEDDSHAE